jgi:hypothetical protein
LKMFKHARHHLYKNPFFKINLKYRHEESLNICFSKI